MRNIFLVSVFAVATLLVIGAVAQQATPPTDRSATMPMGQMMGNMGQMMGQMNHMMGQMTGQMGPMMATNTDAAKLVDQLVNGFAAIENEKDAKVRNEKLAEHGRLLKELQTKLQGQSQMMGHMRGMMMGGMTAAGDKKQ
jgi:hypothetical protein